MESMLVTQNVDDYHEMVAKESPILSKIPDKNLEKYGDDIPCAFTPHVYALHGNTAYMHCKDTSKDCSRDFYRIPSRDEVKDHKNHVPKCEKCGEDMKPHGMFFDESYNEHYYRSESIGEFYLDCDAMIVIGTTLLTSYAKMMVVKTLNREVPVIEINYEPCLKVGHTYQVLGKSDDTLPAMFDAYYKALGVEHVNKDLYAAHFKLGTHEQPKSSQNADNWKKEECKQEKPADILKKPVVAVTKVPAAKTPVQAKASSKSSVSQVIQKPAQKAAVTSTLKAPTVTRQVPKKK
jgi:NAD-dependent SIR2 family protein deacetylase